MVVMNIHMRELIQTLIEDRNVHAQYAESCGKESKVRCNNRLHVYERKHGQMITQHKSIMTIFGHSAASLVQNDTFRMGFDVICWTSTMTCPLDSCTKIWRFLIEIMNIFEMPLPLMVYLQYNRTSILQQDKWWKWIFICISDWNCSLQGSAF